MKPSFRKALTAALERFVRFKAGMVISLIIKQSPQESKVRSLTRNADFYKKQLKLSSGEAYRRVDLMKMNCLSVFGLRKVSFLAAALGALSLATCSKTDAPDPAIKDDAANPADSGDKSDATAVPPVADAGASADTGASDTASALETLYFEFDSSRLTADSQKDFPKVVEAIKNGSGKIRIEGHCDDRGSAEYNLALGERRAKAIYDLLVSKGVEASKLSTISYGKERPVEQGSGEEVWSKNRRVEFTPQ